MKKFSISAMVAAAAMVAAGAAQAQATATFDVNLTLTPTCIITNSSGGASAAALSSDIAVAYTAFGSAATGFTSFFVRCSTALPITSIGLDAFSAIVDGTSGLSYNLALKTANTGDASTAVGSLAGQTGVAAGTQYFVQAYVGAGQAGTTTAGAANNTRTITVTY